MLFTDTNILDRLKELTAELDALDYNEAIRKEKDVELLANAITDMVLVLDINGVVKYANPSSLRISGYTPTELAGKTINKLVDSTDCCAEVSRSKNTVLKNRDGCSIPIHIYVGEMKDATVHFFILVIRKLPNDTT